MLGKALKAVGKPRNEYFVSTKCGRYIEGFNFSAERVTRSIDESLERLQLEYVDILQCHDIEFGSLDQVMFFACWVKCFFFPLFSSPTKYEDNKMKKTQSRGFTCRS